LSPITVWPTKYVTGFNGDNLDALQSLPIVGAQEGLYEKYDCDAHFWPGYLMDSDTGEPLPQGIRVNKKGLKTILGDGMDIRFSLLPLDLDDEYAHAHGVPSRPEWREEIMDALGGLPEELLSGMGWYMTRGGARLLWTLDSLSLEEYLLALTAMRAKMSVYGIQADPLVDWGRGYRLPFVFREKVGFEEYDHDLESLGPLTWDWRSYKVPKESVFTQLGNAGRSSDGGDLAKVIDELRNKSLARLAGQLRRNGLEEEEILDALTIVNEKRCDPPLEDWEVAKIAHSIGTSYEMVAKPVFDPEVVPAEKLTADVTIPSQTKAYQPPHVVSASPPKLLLGSEGEMAHQTVDLLQEGGTQMVFDRASLWRYSPKNGVWGCLEDSEVRRFIAQEFDGCPVLNGLDKNGNWIIKPMKLSANGVKGVHKISCDLLSNAGFFESEKPGVATQDGFITLDARGEIDIQEPDMDNRATYFLDMKINQDDPKMFLKFLDECFEPDLDADRKILLLQEFVGACLMGMATKYQRAVILFGEGANGKSVFQKIVCSLFEGKSITAVAPQDMDNEYRRALLSRSRLNVVTEIPENDILESGSIKALIVGDELDARPIRQDPFSFHPRAGHLFSANTLPGVRDMSHGFWRRWMVIRFNREFSESEQIKGLDDMIIEKEKAQILWWALEGASRLAKNGAYSVPASVQMAVDSWRQEADSVAIYLENCCTVGNDYETSANKIYAHYREWSKTMGHGACSSTKFSVRMKRLGIPNQRKERGRVFRLRINPFAVG